MPANRSAVLNRYMRRVAPRCPVDSKRPRSPEGAGPQAGPTVICLPAQVAGGYCSRIGRPADRHLHTGPARLLPEFGRDDGIDDSDDQGSQ